MRLTLIHNPSAGSGQPSRSELVSQLRATGYDVRYQSTKDEGLDQALEEPGDLVLVAGGDGAVGDVAKCLAGRGTPLAILPLGTANNIAHSLGVDGSPRELIGALRPERLRQAARVPLTLGVARAPWGESRFVEAAGVGLFARLLRNAERTNDARRAHADAGGASAASGTLRITQGRERLRCLLADAPARRWQIEADGQDLSGDYLMAEALVVRSIGPRLMLAPGARPGDGHLFLVLMREDERDGFDAYLAALADGPGSASPLAAHRVRRVCISWEPGHGHLDDELWPAPPARAAAAAAPDVPAVEIETLDSALEILAVHGL